MNAENIKGPLRILRLQAEHIKRLVAIDITPTGDVVQITGKNEAGKSSVLDCILWALGGKEGIQGVPIRRGESEARIRLDLGEVIVTRKFKKKDSGETTTAVTVEAADGSKFTGPQELLNSLLSTLCFDPLAFARMKPPDQLKVMRQFVPDVDFAGIDAANKRDFDKRTDINRRMKEAHSGAEAIKVSNKPPCAAIDETALVAELQSAGERNTERATRQANREKAVARIAELRAAAGGVAERIAKAAALRQAAFDATCTSARNRIEALEKQIALLQKQLESEQDSITAAQVALQSTAIADEGRLQTEADAQRAEADTLQKRLDEAGELPAVIDTAAVRLQIETARDSNQRLAQWIADIKRRDELRKLGDALKAESFALTVDMDAREKTKRDAIKAAKMPVENLDFGIDCILLDGLPFDQASSARRTRVSVAIAMAGNPKLRVCRIQDGSLLDDDGMQIIADMAREHGFQVWVERVDSSGKIGFVISDGTVSHVEAAA